MMRMFKINYLRVLIVTGIIATISGFAVGYLCGRKNDEYEEYEIDIQMEELQGDVMKETDARDREKKFAALKLLQVLYEKGLISEQVWKNIKAEYKDTVELSKF